MRVLGFSKPIIDEFLRINRRNEDGAITAIKGIDQGLRYMLRKSIKSGKPHVCQLKRFHCRNGLL